MSVFEMIRLIIGSAFLFAGIAVFVLEIFGIFRFNYVLNRLHAAAMGDTMGLFLCMMGLCIFSGFNFTTVKMVLVVLLFWIASPVTSHMTALLETYTNTKLSKRLSYEGDLDTLEKKLKKEQEETQGK